MSTRAIAIVSLTLAVPLSVLAALAGYDGYGWVALAILSYFCGCLSETMWRNGL